MTEQKKGKFFWMKMGSSFIERASIRLIESYDLGPTYIWIYLKLLVYSLPNDGYIDSIDEMPATNKMIAFLINIPENIVEEALNLFCDLKLVIRNEEGNYFFTDALKFTGSESKV